MAYQAGGRIAWRLFFAYLLHNAANRRSPAYIKDAANAIWDMYSLEGSVRQRSI